MELDLPSLFGLLCTAVLIGWDPTTPPLPPHMSSYTRALLVSQDRRHLSVTPWGIRISATLLPALHVIFFQLSWRPLFKKLMNSPEPQLGPSYQSLLNRSQVFHTFSWFFFSREVSINSQIEKPVLFSAVLWIRNGSGFNGVPGSGSGSRGAKIYP